jgi:Ribosomal protein L10.
MKKEEKVQIIENIAAQLKETPNFYVADIAGLNAEVTQNYVVLALRNK